LRSGVCKHVTTNHEIHLTALASISSTIFVLVPCPNFITAHQPNALKSEPLHISTASSTKHWPSALLPSPLHSEKTLDTSS
jgi:hypothetical protein